MTYRRAVWVPSVRHTVPGGGPACPKFSTSPEPPCHAKPTMASWRRGPHSGPRAPTCRITAQPRIPASFAPSRCSSGRRRTTTGNYASNPDPCAASPRGRASPPTRQRRGPPRSRGSACARLSASCSRRRGAALEGRRVDEGLPERTDLDSSRIIAVLAAVPGRRRSDAQGTNDSRDRQRHKILANAHRHSPSDFVLGRGTAPRHQEG